ncbi:MAG: sigma 54-interacting transcriptional regulator [Myxococcota bacterium]
MSGSSIARGGETATMARAAATRDAAPNVPFRLEVTAGPSAGTHLVIAPDHPHRVFVGQSAAADLVLADPRVSRRHLACEVIEDGLRVTDLGSTNGTRVNGVSIREGTLAGGETMHLGDSAVQVRREPESTAVSLTPRVRFGRVVGASVAMRKLYPLCKRLAGSDVPVVIEGETGTGKEVLAESLHEASPRRRKPFVVFDCTAVSPNLIESALFGHERGAFTGATTTRRGVFEEADGGTLLIDEIGDLDLDLQAKLLRVLERSEVTRVGASQPVRVDVRILAATRRDLEQLVQERRFRDDLFYRLAVTRIELPPLRDREGDIAILAEHFWGRLTPEGAPLPDAFVAGLRAYPWPGNVRELQNAVARRVALGDLARDGPEGAPPGLHRRPAPSTPDEDGRGMLERILAEELPLPLARKKVVEAFEAQYLQRVLDAHQGNVSRAADAAGVARRYFRLLRARTREREGSS